MVKVIKKMKWLINFFKSTLKVALWSALNIPIFIRRWCLCRKQRIKLLLIISTKKSADLVAILIIACAKLISFQSVRSGEAMKKFSVYRQQLQLITFYVAPIKFPSGRPKWVRRAWNGRSRSLSLCLHWLGVFFLRRFDIPTANDNDLIN